MATGDGRQETPGVSDKDYGGWHFARDFSNNLFGLLNTGRVFPAFGLLLVIISGITVWRLPDSELAPIIRDLIAWLGGSAGFAWGVVLLTNLFWMVLCAKQTKLYREEIKRLAALRSQLMHGENLTLIKKHRTSDGEQAESYFLPPLGKSDSEEPKP